MHMFLEGPGDGTLYTVIVALVGALIFLAKNAAKATEILVDTVKKNTEALSQLTAEISTQGTLNRTALDTQTAGTDEQYRRLGEKMDTLDGAGSRIVCPLSVEDHRKLMIHVETEAQKK